MELKDIYRTAHVLIQQHGDKAQSNAEEKLQFFLDAGDVMAAGIWMRIGNAIEDLTQATAHGPLQ